MSSNLGKAFISQLSKETDHKSLIHICEEMFPIIKEVAKNKNGFEKAMDLLLHLEKLTRNAKHYESNAQVLIEIASLCVETNHWRDLNDYLVILSNRKSFIEKSVVALIKHCLMIIRSIKIEKIIQLELMKVLYGITKGKNYLELERAKLSKVMADHYEEENNVGKAIEILEDLKCETISNLDNREKNIFVISLYYERIYIKRMSEILCITIEKCENLISKLISNGRILAKIDRLTGVINFNKVKRTGQILNDWIFNINELTIKVNNSFHDVNKMQY
ncbi:26S proteasome non-ATPase regulatory subunit 12-like [Condylostylus longicornis]|uniref:26S proteasome non-ATPase regulatory subunit 12-like n=1 Tax=Condylostylus longicornis TaxID=2530218 RepID=UPI00244DCCAF|nr:26S proteasome non-ATPase regulatory subunit 12-like [Condylostylus longicornis]